MWIRRETIEEFEYEGRLFQVDGIWDDETPEGEFDFYELWEIHPEPGITPRCLTEGADPFYERPTRQELLSLIRCCDEIDQTGATVGIY